MKKIKPLAIPAIKLLPGTTVNERCREGKVACLLAQSPIALTTLMLKGTTNIRRWCNSGVAPPQQRPRLLGLRRVNSKHGRRRASTPRAGAAAGAAAARRREAHRFQRRALGRAAVEALRLLFAHLWNRRGLHCGRVCVAADQVGRFGGAARRCGGRELCHRTLEYLEFC